MGDVGVHIHRGDIAKKPSTCNIQHVKSADEDCFLSLRIKIRVNYMNATNRRRSSLNRRKISQIVKSRPNK